MVFRWYFYQTNRWAMEGNPQREVDYQIQCGPALGSFNAWVKGTPIEYWRNRHPDQMAEALMQGAADVLTRRFASFQKLREEQTRNAKTLEARRERIATPAQQHPQDPRASLAEPARWHFEA